MAIFTLSSLTPEIRRFCQTVKRISPSPRSTAILARPRICWQLNLPSGSETPIQLRPSCFCRCTPMWAVRSKPGRGAKASAGTRIRDSPIFSSTSARNFSNPIDDVLHPRLEPVRAISGIDEDAHDRVRNSRCITGFDADAGVPGEILVTGNAADAETKPDTRFDTESILHFDGGKGDVVGILEHRNLARTVEGDIELARQTVKRTVVENVIVPFARVFAGVDQFLRVDSRRRRARHVADVVGARATRTQAEILDTFDRRHSVFRRNFAKLKVGAGGDVAIRSAEALGEVGQARQLPVLENAVGNSQAAHIGVLRWRDIKQTKITPAKIVRRIRRRIVSRLLLQPLIGIEGMLFALEFFLVCELLAGSEHLVLRLEVCRVRTARRSFDPRATICRSAAQATPNLVDLQTSSKAFEIALLLVGKFDGKSLHHHDTSTFDSTWTGEASVCAGDEAAAGL